MLWLVPSIERQGVLVRALWGAVFLGGVGRLLSMVTLGLLAKGLAGGGLTGNIVALSETNSAPAT